MIRLAAAFSLLSIAACGSATTAATRPPTTTVTTTTTQATTTTALDPVIGHSREGRPIEAYTIGTGPHRLFIIGSIHGDERPAAENARALFEHLRADPPNGWTIRFVVDANPDGTAAGTRDNAAGVDLNRNWPSEGFAPATGTGPAPLSEPEAEALEADIAAFAPDLIVALHAAREGPFVEFDGADGAPAAHRFASGASSVGRTWLVVPDVAWPTVGSIGTYYGDEGRIPVVTVEANRWDTPESVTNELIAGITALLSSDSGQRMALCEEHEIGITCAGPTAEAHELIHAATEGGVHGFVVKEVGGPVLAALNADTRFYPASTLKLVHFAHALAWMASGGDPAEPVTIPADGCAGTGAGPAVPLAELLDRMMQASDNAAANALQAYFGVGALEATIASAGMEDTALVHGFGCGGPANDPPNATTAVDLIRLLEGVVDGSVVPPSSWSSVEEAMLDVAGAAGLDGGIRVLAKEGWYGTTMTIAGIAIRPDGTSVVFAAFTDGATTIEPGFAIAELAGVLVGGSG